MAETSETQWVEIIEPQSKERMFANPSTGEISLTAPDGVKIKPMSQNQWWELYDAGSDSYYYYNAHTGDTVWDRPGDDADIIPLTKLQSTSAEETSEETDGGQPVTTQANEVPGTTPNSQPTLEPAPTQDPNLRAVPVERKLSEILSEHIEPMSPLAIDYEGERFASASGTNKSQVSPTSGDMTTLDKTRTLDGSNARYMECAHGARDSWVNINVVSKEGVNGEQERLDVLSESGGSFPGGSLDRSARGRDQLATPTSYEMKSRTLDNSKRKGSSREGRSYVPARPAPTPPTSRGKTGPSLEKTKSVEHDSLDGEEKAHHRSRSDIPPAPAPPQIRSDRAVSVVSKTSLANFKDLSQHRKGFFRKKVTIANMLAWTKDPIKQPMLQTRDKQLRKEACEMFKLLLQYMGDRKTKQKDVNLIALDITSQAWEKKGLRDELYIQLCRQTSSNSNPKSLRRGWEMFAICLALFPPSIKFRGYLEGYLWRHVEPSPAFKGVPVEVFAQYCHKRVEKMAQSGAKKGVKKPAVEEIIHAKDAPFNPSMFGNTLEDTMELQQEKFPSFDQKLPWVVPALTEAVLRLQGPQTEGIFRVPGDIDEVNILKLKLDKGLVTMDKLSDPHVPASLLKLWFRELEEPLIPAGYYDECINNCDNEMNALSLVDSLPELNKKLLLYLVDFLKQFITPENIEATKMGLDNIAMVWAPNFLRCPSDDHTLIFQNTRKEMAFLRVLLRLIDTNSSATASAL
ncbi:rho GTPase-activating protein 39-like isoform X2 [Halichondria panicea]|uniref:rho GTPase-activating protein 39-like isoform X2 n=1 Tax=Halichondria panicea TaxID=6063 RepID=UPI00312BBAEF